MRTEPRRVVAAVLAGLSALLDTNAALRAEPSASSEPVPSVPEPIPPASRALVADVERVIAGYEDDGWFVDEKAYSEVEELLLESVCRAPVAARVAAHELLRLRASAEPETLFQAAGRRLTPEVERALTLKRQRVALERTLARQDECPFWIVPSADFAGRQTVRNKWVVHLEGGGLVEIERSESKLKLGAGGNGRLLLGRGFGDHLGINAGLELGGGAALSDAQSGRLSLRYNPAVPVVLRWHERVWFYDLELAPVAVFETDNTELSWGGRVGFAVGLTTLRTRDFLPWVGIAIGAEHYLAADGRPAFQLLRGGLRVGIRWLP